MAEGFTGSYDNKYPFLKDAEELVRELNNRWDRWYNHSMSMGMYSIWQRAYQCYYGQMTATTYTTGLAGEQDEYSTIQVNHARNVIKHVIAMVTQNRINFDVICTNTDISSRNTANVARAVLDQLIYERRFEREYHHMLEMGLIFGVSYLAARWQPSRRLIGADGDGNPVYAGEPELKVYSPLDVMVDPLKPYFRDQQYVVTREMANRNDLAADYPDLAEKILAVEKIHNFPYFAQFYEYDEENIWLYTAYHRPTPALPQGRLTRFLKDDIVLEDGVNIYDELPIFQYRPDTRHGTAYGHTPLFDLMPVQESLNQLDSAFLTIIENFSIPNFVASKRSGIDETELSGGLRMVLADPDPDAPNAGFPTVMQMPGIPPDMVRQREAYIRDIEALSGVNSIVRGSPSQFVPSGTAIALLSSSAQTYNSAVERGYIQIIEESAYSLLSIIRKFQRYEDIITITGKANAFSVSQFKGEDLEGVRQVRVHLGNPVSKTFAGKMAVADQLLANQMLTSPAEYLDILKTGNIDTVTDPKVAQRAYVQLENEQLASGQKPVISYLDNPISHIQEHMTLTFRPEVRQDANILALIMEHVQEHLDQIERLNMGNPIALALATEQPVPLTALMQPAGMSMSGGGGVPAPGTPETPGASQTAQAASQEGGVESVAASGLKRALKQVESADQVAAAKKE
jgi:hypothetical protein